MATSRSCSGADAYLGLRRLFSMDRKDKITERALILAPRSLEAGRRPLEVSHKLTYMLSCFCSVPTWAPSPTPLAARAQVAYRATQGTPGIGERAALGYPGPWECTGRASGARGKCQWGVPAPRLASPEFPDPRKKTREPS